MKITPAIILCIIATGLFACKGKVQKSEFSLLQIKEFRTSADFKNIEVVPSRLILNPKDSIVKLYFQNWKSREIFSFSLSKDSLLPIHEITINNPEFYFLYYIVSSDSIFQFNNELKCLFLRNKSGATINTYTINPEFTPLVMFPMDMTYNNNTLLIGNTSKTQGMGLQKDRLFYYKAIKPLLKITITDTNVACLPSTKFPEKYITTGNNYEEVFPSACFEYKGNICVSFGADDYLSLYYDSTLLMQKPVKSEYIDKFTTYPDEKGFDMLYHLNYIKQEPRYIKVVFDPYRNLYYRLVKHRRSKIQVEKNEPFNWSVIILDTELNVIGEELISPEFNIAIFVPTPFGIIMGKESTDASKNIVLTLMKLEINEK